MKLELKNLAPYLPYGIKFQTPYGILELTNISVLDRYKVWFEANNPKDINYKILRENHCIGKGFYLKTVKPILRPISDLVKDISLSLQTYSFIDLFEIGDTDGCIWEFDNSNIKTIQKLKTIAKYNVIHDINYLPHAVVQLMFEYHFDVFGLIDAGLAIDINTVPELLNG